MKERECIKMRKEEETEIGEIKRKRDGTERQGARENNTEIDCV